jgi:uncharacterized tellurite resistance protein B-like protein
VTSSDRIFPLCELLLGAAHADQELAPSETREIRALLVELAGEARVEVDAAIASFDPTTFDLGSLVGYFKGDSEEDRRKVLLLASTVVEADEVIDFAENEFLKKLCAGLNLPASCLAGLVIDIEMDDIKDVFAEVSQVRALR